MVVVGVQASHVRAGTPVARQQGNTQVGAPVVLAWRGRSFMWVTGVGHRCRSQV